MLYIIVALKSEAQAFVDKYKLTKTRCNGFTIFVGKDLRLIISGVGCANAKKATTVLIEKFNPSSSDIFINVGICGASQKYRIGELLKIGSVLYEDQKYTIDADLDHTIICSHNEVYEDLYEIVDMESFGFYEATIEIKNRYIFKVVSDHFKPLSVTKEGTKMLIFSMIDEIIDRIKF